MIEAADRRALVAVDLGAQSCRVSLLRWLPSGPRIELIHRVANGPQLRDGHWRWDLAAICEAADEGLRRCAARAPEGIATIGVTGWAVDYVRMDAAGKPIADPFCYRDTRNQAAMESVHRRISASRVYARTGIQVIPFNTLYQLVADTTQGIAPDLRWLNLPEFLLYRWGAQPVAEYTNATHTALVELGTLEWSREIFDAAGLSMAAAPRIVPPGSIVGELQGPLAELPALQHTLLIAPACHDTASAIAGIPAQGDDWAYISSGTWSLVGTVVDTPCAGAEAAQWNFTNEGGAGGQFCLLRNVNGLWLLEQCMAAWNGAGERIALEPLLQAAAQLSPPQALLDVDEPALMSPGDMPKKITEQMNGNHGRSAAKCSSPAEITSLILHSLAARYAQVLRQAETLSGKRFARLFVVGGGSRNALLNRLTAQATGLEVICGAQESSTIGNFALQLSAMNSLHDHPAPDVDLPDQRTQVAHWAAQLSGVEIAMPSSPSDARNA